MPPSSTRGPGPAASIALVALLATASGLQTPGESSSAGSADPFGVFAGTVELDVGDRRDMSRREIVARTLDATDQTVSVFVGSAIDADADRLVAKVRDIESLRTSEIVPIVRRFSSPPVLADLDDLTLERDDLDGIRSCRPGDCDLKLTVPEMERLGRVIAAAGDGWRVAVQREFRRIVLERVRVYLAEGRVALGAYHDHDTPVDLASTFGRLLGGLDALGGRPALVRHVARFPRSRLAPVESFIYWSEETYAPKPIITVWHDHILRGSGRDGEPEVLIVGAQLFATHYLDGAVSVTALLRDSAGPGGAPRRYLVYVNRTSIDWLDGFMAGVRRFFLERRLRGEARKIFDEQRRRIEAPIGPAPAGTIDDGSPDAPASPDASTRPHAVGAQASSGFASASRT